MKPEEEAELIIWDWLKTKSKFVKEVYFNRENKLGWKKFRVEGLQKKPDFLVLFNRNFGDEYIAVEIKNASSSKSVIDAGKIFQKSI